MTLRWIRTCQECFHERETPPPPANTLPTDAWREIKCTKCKSPALDWGSWKEVNGSSS